MRVAFGYVCAMIVLALLLCAAVVVVPLAVLAGFVLTVKEGWRRR